MSENQYLELIKGIADRLEFEEPIMAANLSPNLQKIAQDLGEQPAIQFKWERCHCPDIDVPVGIATKSIVAYFTNPFNSKVECREVEEYWVDERDQIRFDIEGSVTSEEELIKNRKLVARRLREFVRVRESTSALESHIDAKNGPQKRGRRTKNTTTDGRVDRLRRDGHTPKEIAEMIGKTYEETKVIAMKMDKRRAREKARRQKAKSVVM